MIGNVISLDFMRQRDLKQRRVQPDLQRLRGELSYELQKYLHVLGPAPKRCLETLADLGLSDPEIARYFKIPISIVTALRLVWNIDGEI